MVRRPGLHLHHHQCSLPSRILLHFAGVDNEGKPYSLGQPGPPPPTLVAETQPNSGFSPRREKASLTEPALKLVCVMESLSFF